MGRQKSTPSKLNTDFQRPIDYIPAPRRRNKKRNPATSGMHAITIPSEKNKKFYLGQVLVGKTDNHPPDNWKTCKMKYTFNTGTNNEHLLINLDETSIIVQILPENKLPEDIITCKIFAINVSIADENVYFDLYFSDLPLPKFNKRLGSCVQIVLWLLLGISFTVDYDDNDVDLSSENVVANLYKSIRSVREQELSLGSENMQHSRLKPILRPYQADAVRWMLQVEKKDTSIEDDLHPLYTVIKLKSGLDIYYDKHSGYVDITKPTVEAPIRGGILADEMGLGKTVEVLACILQHPKPSNSESDIDLLEKPTLELMSRKRKLQDPKPDPPPVDTPKKLKVPDDWVKTSSKKSQTYVALQMWYNSVLQSPSTSSPTKQKDGVQCICGAITNEDTVTCNDCGKIQHGACLGYKSKFGPYRCPQCWKNQPLIECKGTLIVSPGSLRTQWCKEICRHIRGDFKVLQYSGSSATPIYPTQLANYDIVITTYSVLQTELRLTETEKAVSLRHQRRYSTPGSPLTRVQWWRLCLDEAQTVETTTSMVSAMAKKLNAQFRWAITGTPIVKEISDLYGLIDYLQMEPYNDIYTWEHLLFNPYIRGDTAPMLKFLSQVLWRSSKDEVIDQINIPKQTIKEHWFSFSTVEQYFYKCEHQSNRTSFLSKARKYGSTTPLQSLDKSTLKNVLAPLLSLRQVCTYPNTVKSKYFATRNPKKTMVKTVDDLLEALIAKNTNESEELLRIILSALNGLAGVYILLQSPEAAVEQYRKVLQLYTRFTEEEKIAKLSVDKLQIVHSMHNLAEILEVYPPKEKTLRDEVLRRDCLEIEKKYIKKFINQSMLALQESLLISSNVEKLQNSFVLSAGRWYSDLLEWIYVHSYEEDLYSKIQNMHSIANVECTIDFRNARSLIYALSKWDKQISKLRETALDVVNDLYTHAPEDEFQVMVSQELVQNATDCHLRPVKNKKSKKKCPVCDANDHLKEYEFKLFSMGKRTVNFEEMSLKGSWKPTPQELIFRSILTIGRAKNADNDLVNDGEIHTNILDTLKKEFKEVRKLWTYLDQQICAQDELDMCKIRLRLKEPTENIGQPKSKITPILKNLAYTLENKLETINLLEEHEVDHQRIVLQNEAIKTMELLEKNLGTRNYLETLHQQRNENQSPDPCPICKNALENHWGIVPCGHSYCLECIQLLTKQTRGQCIQCSVCRAFHSISEISYTKTEEDEPDSDEVPIVGNYSTKVESIVKLIRELKSEEPDVKILVFSSWVSVLSYIKDALVANDISTELLASGTLEKQIEKFKSTHVTSLLLPLNLGGKGLNLIEATHVILTEPLLNSGEELQAIGRVHRIGQTKPTVVHKFFIKDTIEESIQKAVSSNAQNWEKNKITIGQLVELFGQEENPENAERENYATEM